MVLMSLASVERMLEDELAKIPSSVHVRERMAAGRYIYRLTTKVLKRDLTESQIRRSHDIAHVRKPSPHSLVSLSKHLIGLPLSWFGKTGEHDEGHPLSHT
jgi:hypothetical protein